ncbi:MAG: cation:proton antiporter [Thermoleophilia bacterium]
MESFDAFFPDLLVVAAWLLAALTAAPLAQRVGLPAPAAFLLVGIVAGATGGAPFDGLETLPLEELGALALYAILFQGGLATGFREWRRSARPILLLGLPGTAATAAALAAFAHYALRLDWGLAALVGIALSPTDPAAVYATLRGRSGVGRARATLEGESGFNDPIGISLMLVAVAMLGPEGASVADGVVQFVEQLAIGLAGGVIGAGLLLVVLRAMPRLEDGLQAVAVLGGAVAIGAATASLHGSGFLAVYLAGLLIADAWHGREGRHHAVPESLAAGAEPVLFGLLGATFAPLTTWTHVWQGIVLTVVTVLIVRPAVVTALLVRSGFTRGERRLVSWGGLKGAVPLLLAAYPGLEQLDETIDAESIVLVATTASVLLQGAALPLVARGSATDTVETAA